MWVTFQKMTENEENISYVYTRDPAIKEKPDGEIVYNIHNGTSKMTVPCKAYDEEYQSSRETTLHIFSKFIVSNNFPEKKTIACG